MKPTTANAIDLSTTATRLRNDLSTHSWPATATPKADALETSLKDLSAAASSFDGSSQSLTAVTEKSQAVGLAGAALEKAFSCATAF